jgi:cytochrome c2
LSGYMCSHPASTKRLCCTSVIFAVLSLPSLLFGCGENARDSDNGVGGDRVRGAALIQQSGCGACHVIPGIKGAEGLVGPSLEKVGVRVYIAGVRRNTPDNMIAWLRHPQSIVANNAMPDMGLSDQQARDIASYLYTLD